MLTSQLMPVSVSARLLHRMRARVTILKNFNSILRYFKTYKKYFTFFLVTSDDSKLSDVKFSGRH